MVEPLAQSVCCCHDKAARGREDLFHLTGYVHSITERRHGRYSRQELEEEARRTLLTGFLSHYPAQIASLQSPGLRDATTHNGLGSHTSIVN